MYLKSCDFLVKEISHHHLTYHVVFNKSWTHKDVTVVEGKSVFIHTLYSHFVYCIYMFCEQA